MVPCTTQVWPDLALLEGSQLGPWNYKGISALLSTLPTSMWGKSREILPRPGEIYWRIPLSHPHLWSHLERPLYLLGTCHTPEETQRTWEGARHHARRACPSVGASATTALDQHPQWNYNDRTDSRARDNMIQYLINGIKKCIKTPVHYDKINKMTQDKGENPAMHQGCLIKTLRKYTDINFQTPDVQALLSHYFISQSTPDILRKLQKWN